MVECACTCIFLLKTYIIIRVSVAMNHRYQRTDIKVLKNMLGVPLNKELSFRSYESSTLFDLKKNFFKNLLKQSAEDLDYCC